MSGDGDRFALDFENGIVTSVLPDGTEHLDLRVDRRSLLALVDGELSLEDALRQDGLELRGDLRHVIDFFDGLLIYLRGGIRCPSFPQLLADFRASSAGAPYEVSR